MLFAARQLKQTAMKLTPAPQLVLICPQAYFWLKCLLSYIGMFDFLDFRTLTVGSSSLFIPNPRLNPGATNVSPLSGISPDYPSFLHRHHRSNGS